jgi:hypothetical protein
MKALKAGLFHVTTATFRQFLIHGYLRTQISTLRSAKMYKGAYILLKTRHHFHLIHLHIFVISKETEFLIPEKLEVLNK